MSKDIQKALSLMTKIIKPSQEAISETANALLNNGIVIIPTIRWYMICSKAENQECIEKIFEAKNRPMSKQPLFVLANKADADSYFELGHGAKQLIEKLWPGELSLLLTWADRNKASRFKAIDQTHALTSNPPGILGEIANAVSVPLAATTVNISEPFDRGNLGPAISLQEALFFIRKTGIKIDITVDGGICPAFTHTTIIDCRFINEVPKIVREGFVHERAIKEALNSEMSEE